MKRGGERKSIPTPKIEAVVKKNCELIDVDRNATLTTKTAANAETALAAALTGAPQPNDIEDNSKRVTLTQRSKPQVTGNSEGGEDGLFYSPGDVAAGICLSMPETKLTAAVMPATR